MTNRKETLHCMHATRGYTLAPIKRGVHRQQRCPPAERWTAGSRWQAGSWVTLTLAPPGRDWQTSRKNGTSSDPASKSTQALVNLVSCHTPYIGLFDSTVILFLIKSGRGRGGDFWEMGLGAYYGLFQRHRYHLELSRDGLNRNVTCKPGAYYLFFMLFSVSITSRLSCINLTYIYKCKKSLPTFDFMQL